jgi:endonuclease VIII
VPEGHTIHRLARDHRRDLVGPPVAACSPQQRFAAGAAVINGGTIDRIEAYGKHLFYWWSGGEVLHVHLGLFGRFRRHRGDPPPPPRPTARLRLAVPGAAHDLSGPSDCSLGRGEDRDRIVARLGPDPLRRDADPERAIDRWRASRAPIGRLLMDQSVVAGVGNVFRAESLYVHGIHPETPGHSLDEDTGMALWTTLTTMLTDGVRRNRIVTVDRAELAVLTGTTRPRARTTYVYRRAECLRCGTPIERWAMANRWAYACPRCQPRPAPA